jgi:hypothetical protein
MADHITTCVNCHGDIPDGREAYCSDECKHENESPHTDTFPPSPREQEIQAEIAALVERDGEVRIEL